MTFRQIFTNTTQILNIQFITRNNSFIVLLIFILHTSLLLSQQEINGNYLIQNYDRIQHQFGTQNWDIAELENGSILIANNSGVLIFNGISWKIIPLPNKSIVRSIATTPYDMIFVGGQDEIGFLKPGIDGNLIFHSIADKIPPNYKPLEDIWEIIYHDDVIYFRSVNRVYEYNLITKNVSVIDPEHPLISILFTNDKLYYHDLFRGIVEVQDTNKLFPNSEFFMYKQLLEIIQIENEYFFITETNGIFKLANNKLRPINKDLNTSLVQSRLFSASKLNNKEIALGTQFDGILIIDTNGNVINRINKTNGLINNNVQTLLLDHGNRLWAGTSNGISAIEINSSIRKLEPDDNKSSSFYDVQLHKDKIYFASNSGVFSTPLFTTASTPKYEFIENSQGQVWGLDVIGDELFMGHNNGAYTIENNIASKMSEIPGAWKFVPTSNPNFLYTGTYTGIDIYKKDAGKWSFYKKLSGFSESSRIMFTVQKNELWVSHPYRGVYKITHDDNFEVQEVKIYDENDGLPSNLLNYIFHLDGIPYVTGSTGVYRYDRIYDQWIIDEAINNLLGPQKNVRRLIEINENAFWFISEDEVGIVSGLKSGNLSKKLYPELVGQTVGGFENISLVNSSLAFVCTDRSVLKVDMSKNIEEEIPKIAINEVRLTVPKDSMLFGGYSTEERKLVFKQKDEIELNYKHNALQFTFSNPYHNERTMYAVKLEKSEEGDWSHWSEATSKEFNNLKYGNYVFSVKTKDQLNVESDPAVYTFEILPPWYLSLWAKTIYSLLILIGLASIIIIPQKKYTKDKEVLIEAKIQSDEALEKVRTEKLKADIEFKNAELASSTLHLVQKNETINKIRSELEAFNKDLKDRNLKKELKKVLSLVNSDERMEDDWENFSAHFDQVHTNFLSRLSKEFPDITPKDRKLCAYLRMNLSTKEIAPLLHISVRGVEISRYRLRKKLNLDKEQNLNDFMINF
ncbi:two-component regulator propeller domain-containing protein [Portibacter lacus]|uniref:HTH luxR-type domain-containing protein n=1 Tax=Portibacter lacus TaxID=1099794 RepID=A0AA37WG42_9BACT|nr:two-component regulator propeller domain-containing protein [Portibacter lacus]GLR17640.1 hypothetical protein GCM10007940_22550 [Portibacter lacus]